MNTAIILAGGTGTRLGADVPKQYLEVNGRAIISYCLETFQKMDDIDHIQIVADRMWQEDIKKYMSCSSFSFSLPGQNRQLSVWNGLNDIIDRAKEDDLVIIHDAARPCVTDIMISNCIQAAKEHDGVIPVLPMKDTVYISSNGGQNITSLINRSSVFAGQAPECFNLKKYYMANKKLFPEKLLEINGSTEPAILAGMDIVTIRGDEHNFKITTLDDLHRFRQIIEG